MCADVCVCVCVCRWWKYATARGKEPADFKFDAEWAERERSATWKMQENAHSTYVANNAEYWRLVALKEGDLRNSRNSMRSSESYRALVDGELKAAFRGQG